MFRHRHPARPSAQTARAIAVTAALAASVVACGSDDDVAVDATDVAGVADSLVDEVDGIDEIDTTSAEVAETLRENGLESIAAVVEEIDISEVFGEQFTFFAPNDEAFTTLSADEAADLLTDPTQVVDVLRNHTLADAVTSTQLVDMATVDTEAGETIPVESAGDVVELGELTIVTTDLEVGDGIVHVVDGFLLP
jgi:uncharacterized surface protein with fasciclin (FAS1) repeats